jgi:hypothetical protein
MSDPKRVVKAVAPAQLFLADGGVLQGRLYLSPASPSHSGPQTPAELLGEPRALFPFQLADGDFLMVGRATVAAVRVPGTAEPSELLVPLFARLRLAGGHRLEGYLLGERGAGDRLSDALNTADPWVRLDGDESSCWVAKRHLVTVEPLPA